MKPRNFSEARNRRRKGALERIGSRIGPNDNAINAEVDILTLRIMPGLRAVRTKKRRSGAPL